MKEISTTKEASCLIWISKMNFFQKKFEKSSTKNTRAKMFTNWRLTDNTSKYNNISHRVKKKNSLVQTSRDRKFSISRVCSSPNLWPKDSPRPNRKSKSTRSIFEPIQLISDGHRVCLFPARFPTFLPGPKSAKYLTGSLFFDVTRVYPLCVLVAVINGWFAF